MKRRPNTAKARSQAREPSPAPHLALVLLIYCLSGASALMYQVVWVRLLKLVLGSTVQASSIVVSVFLGGLGLGALLMSRYADSIRSRLRLYALLEVAITAAALLMPWLLHGLESLYAPLYNQLLGFPALATAVQSLLCLTVLLLPTMLMGSTLPLMSRYVTSSELNIGSRVGSLYLVNTLGAAAGCFLAGFILIRSLGVSGTLYAAAALNLLAAAAAAWLARTSWPTPDTQPPPAPSSPAPPSHAADGRWIPIALFISGLVSIGYEIVWMRSLAIPLGSFTYVFSAVLTVYLLGYVLGVSMGSALSGRLKTPIAGLGISLGLLGILGLLHVVAFRSWFEGWGATLGHWIAQQYPGPALMFSPLLHCLALFTLPALAMGVGYPLALQAWASSHKGVGRTSGTAYAINTTGSVFGGLITGFILIPHAGVQFTMTLLGSLALLTGLVLTWRQTRLSPRIRGFAAAAAAAALIMVLLLPSDTFSQLATMGLRGQTLRIAEGTTTTVVVSRLDDGHKLMAIDSIQMAGDDAHRSAQKTLGHLPMLLHPKPIEILGFGFGTGETLASLACHPVQRIECVEIAPEVTAVARDHFQHIHGNILQDTRVRMLHLDGRNHLRLTDQLYDVIVNDSDVHGTVGSAPLYSRDHFENARNHLKPGGLFMTKLHLQGYPRSSLDCILRTFTQSFPHTTLWIPITRPFVFFYLVGSREPQQFSPAGIDQRLALDSVRSGVDYLRWTDSMDVLAGYLGDQTDLQRALPPGPIHTDNQPFLEFNEDPTRMVRRQYLPELVSRLASDSLSQHLDLSGLDASSRETWVRAFQTRRQVAALLLKAHAEDTFMSRLLCAQQGLALLPDYPPLRALQAEAFNEISLALDRGQIPPGQLVRDMDSMTSRMPTFSGARVVQAIASLKLQKTDAAVGAAREATQLDPGSWPAVAWLARALLAAAQPAAAESVLQPAATRWPHEAEVHELLARCALALGRRQEAAFAVQAALRSDPHHRPAQLLAETLQAPAR